MNNWLYTGTVAHKRIGVAANTFNYPALFLCFPLSARAKLSSPLFGYNRFNLLSFYEKDYGNGIDAASWIRSVLADAQLSHITSGEVWLQTQPRVFGYVFNPVSFWYCHDNSQQLRAVLCEVNNTFGERHCYLLTAPQHEIIKANTKLQCQKVFHVSPFFDVDGEYRFQFLHQGTKRTVAINYWLNDKLQLKTLITGEAHALNSTNIGRSLLRLGWTTVGVVARIHWQAFKLWRKGATFYKKPTPPRMEISS
jgi:DUF1365 family protein